MYYTKLNMRGWRLQRKCKSDKKMSKKQENTVVTEVGNQEDGGRDDTESAAGEEATVVHQKVLPEGLAQLSEELRGFKQDVKRDLGEFRTDVMKTMKENFNELKPYASCRVNTQASPRHEPV